MAVETATILMFIGLGVFIWVVIMRMNLFLGNLGFMLLGFGMLFYFVQQGDQIFGFGGLMIGLFSGVKMIYDLFKPTTKQSFRRRNI